MKALTSTAAPDGPLSFVSRWWQNVKTHYAAAGEMANRDEAEMAQLARDVGISASELRTLAGKWPDQPDLLPRRIEALGLDIAQITREEPQVLRDLERVCAQCDARKHCRHDLDHDEADREWRDYCPNVATLDALRSEDRDNRLLRRGRKWRSF